jgi:hypothetical protein
MKHFFAVLLLLIACTWAVGQKTHFVEPKLEGVFMPSTPIMFDSNTSVGRYLPIYASAPTCARVGQMYYDSGATAAYYCTVTGSPGTWVGFGSSGGALTGTSLSLTGSGVGSEKFYDADGSNFAGWVSPSTVTADYQFEFPNSGFSAGVLKAAAIGSNKSVLTVIPIPYDLSVAYAGTPAASAALRFVAVRAFDSGSAWAGSVCSGATAATAQTDFLLKVNGTTKATLRFAASGTTCTIVSGTTTAVAATDVVTIVAPASPDATLADVAITLLGSLN